MRLEESGSGDRHAFLRRATRAPIRVFGGTCTARAPFVQCRPHDRPRRPTDSDGPRADRPIHLDGRERRPARCAGDRRGVASVGDDRATERRRLTNPASPGGTGITSCSATAHGPLPPGVDRGPLRVLCMRHDSVLDSGRKTRSTLPVHQDVGSNHGLGYGSDGAGGWTGGPGWRRLCHPRVTT